MSRTIVYVDGFNLYYRALKKTPYKWLDLYTLCVNSLPKDINVVAVNFYTARISARLDPNSPRDQNTYLSALKTNPKITIHYGSFNVHNVKMYLTQPIELSPIPNQVIIPNPLYAKVVKTEEKGSDVNLGVHLVRDAFMGKFDHAAVITNDSDLAEPLRIVTQEANLSLTLLTPVKKEIFIAKSLKNVVTNTRFIDQHIPNSQFPNQIKIANGTTITKPKSW
ncbi:NYN domain-containing protein [Orbaceae bacterium ESL0721]|nr:NYN domain-containing protein [Orbaceae bacterium ESL0721]